MHQRLFSLLSLSWLVAASQLTACGDDEGANAASTTSSSSSSSGSGGAGGQGGAGGDGGSGGAGGSGLLPVAVQFEGRVGADVFSCGKNYHVGTGDTEVGISDFRLYIHDVQLHRADGQNVPVELDQDGLWQFQNLALLDFEDKTGSCSNGTQPTNQAIRGTVPVAVYDGLSFKLGVPFELNHADAASAPSPLNLSGLFWSWEAGYKFARIDTVPTGGNGSFFLHLGSTGCVADANGGVSSCERANVAEVVLTGFDPLTKKVLVDFATLVAACDLAADTGGAPGCMSGEADPECLPIFERLGIDISDGSLHPELQKFFRVE